MKTTILLKLQLGILFFCLFTGITSYAQKEANNWLFNGGAGITFNYNPPQGIVGGKAYSNYGHASISDTNGNLMFYTGTNNGTIYQLWNGNHQPLANSNNLEIGQHPNNPIIVPWPGQSQKYFLFSSHISGSSPGPTTNYEGYSVIDMTLNNGQGAVTSIKSVYLTEYSNAAVIGVKHRNNRDYWVIHQQDSASVFHAFLVSPSGLNTTPIISRISNFSHLTGTLTAIKASPDGKTLAFSTLDTPFSTIHLLDFDPATGLVSYKGNLPDNLSSELEFSPDGTKLYVHRNSNGSTYGLELVQYDLDAGTPAAIFNSVVSILQFQAPTVTHVSTSIQVGPNGKIYSVSEDSAGFLNVINRPNLKGKACRFVPYSFQVPFDSTQGFATSLPSFIQSYFYRPKITMQQTCFGDTAFFALGNPAYVDSVDWNFGDPASGAQNTSTLFNPKHFYATPGPKQVQAIVHFNFYSDTLNQTIYIPVGITKPNLGNDTTLCQGDTLLLNAYQPGASYEWQDSINTDSVYVVTKPGTYWVSVSNGCGTLGDSITVNFSNPLSLALPKDTVLCPGQTLTLQVNPQGGNLLWSDSTAANSFTVSKPGTYWAELSNACGSWRDSITVNYRPVVGKNWLPKDTVLCNTSPFIINGTNPAALSYKWQDGSTFPSFTATVSGTYWLEITTECATLRDSIQVTINKLPETSFKDTTICSGDSFTLTAPIALSYRWNTGDTAQSISINQAGKYKVELETVKGCFYSDSLEVKTERCFKTAFIPNIVTPNNDQLNDKFEPKGLETGEYELSIYNRWGTRIYQQQNYTNQWPEEKISAGTYYYLLRNKQSGKTYKGWVEVMK